MKQQDPKTWTSVFSSLVMPLALGLAMYLCLGLLIDREVITNELILRYLTGHPISRITTFMFCVGLAGLLLLANNVFDQFCNCDRIRLDETQLPDNDQDLNEPTPVDQAKLFLDQLFQFKRSVRTQYLWHRLFGALSFIKRTGGSAGIEDELKYLSDIDQERQQRRYSLIRIVIWATPMLGFLGTVLGISQALGGIQVGPENDFQAMLNGLRASLFVAFDTTALALTLSIVLMFMMFFVDRFEQHLLETVQRRANEELLPLYQGNVFIDPQTRAVERIGRTVMASTHNLVRQQTDQWQETFKTAEDTWSRTVSEIGETIREGLSESLRTANVDFADSITRGINRADESMAKRWEQWQVLLSENARQLSHNQMQILNQIKLIEQLLKKIEMANGAQHMLNRNLDALAATSQLHTTLKSLADSIQEIKKSSNQGTESAKLQLYRPELAQTPKQTASDLRKGQRKAA